MSKQSIQSFEDLECWKACRESRKYVSVIIKKFPSFEKYALVNGYINYLNKAKKNENIIKHT